MSRHLLLLVTLIAFAFGQEAQSSANELFREVVKASEERDNSKMEFWLREMYSRYPQDLRGSVLLLEVLETRNKLPEALKLAGEIRKQAETNWRYLAAVGRIYFKQERFRDAIQEFQVALRYAETPYEQGGSWNLLGQTYQAAGDVDEAIAAFRRAKAINGRANPFLAIALSAKGDREGAILEYRAVLVQDPNQILALNNLAYALAQEGRDLDEALGYAGKAVEVAPGNSFYVDTLGWVLFKKGQLAAAETELVRATKMENGNSSVHWEHLAAVMDARGDWSGERRELRDLLRGEATPRKLARVKELLGKME